MREIQYVKNSKRLNAEKFLDIVVSVEWAGKNTWALNDLEMALSKVSGTYSAWLGEEIVGFVRVLSDDLIFSCIPEILVRPDFQSCGVGTR